MEYKLYNIDGSETQTKFKLNKSVFGVTPNDHCIYLTIKSELASNRQGTNSTKTRAEVSGGGAKPWKQKGTGRARVGSSRNPPRVHGGVAFGPRPRKYKLKVNKKVKRLAKSSVLSQKLSDKKLIIVENF
jgi:large subunit ribosomal protein L4